MGLESSWNHPVVRVRARARVRVRVRVLVEPSGGGDALPCPRDGLHLVQVRAGVRVGVRVPVMGCTWCR